MTHIDEHTLELYILGSDLVADRRSEIESHIAECTGCRSLAEKIEQFYQLAEEELAKDVQPAPKLSTSLVRSHQDIEPFYEPYDRPVRYQPTTFVGKFQYLVRRHPVIAGASGFAAVAVIAAAIFFTMKDAFKDTNPAYAHINHEGGFLEAYNKENEVLWKIPSKGINNEPADPYNDYNKEFVVADLHKDGRNEVITTLPLGERQVGIVPLTILSENGKVVREVWFKTPVQFRGTKYNDDLNAEFPIVVDFSDKREKEIIVSTNNGRSPTVIYRLTSNGDVVGEYYHFGLVNISSIDLKDEGHSKIVLFGENDIDEPDSLPFPVITILDPEKINGRAEAGDSPGFGLPNSNAELYVIRFPLSDMNIALSAEGFVFQVEKMSYGTENGIAIEVLGEPTDKRLSGKPKFQYLLGEDMRVREVKFESGTIRLRDEMIAQGKLKGNIDKAYLENLKNGVRYWDGKEWRSEVVTVNQTNLP